jgi:type I restriction-modification system DNA methylase subunit
VQAWDEAAAKLEVARLVREFEEAKSEGRLSRYGDSRYGEEATKKDFILPLFRALGWRVEDSREVSAEERVLRGRADYGFKIADVTKFYVEAKTLSKNLMEREHLQQAIDYSYAKGVPWAVLSNFAQTVVLYSEVKDPNPFNCRFIELTASEYVPEFDRLRLLSRTAIANHELDSKAEKFGRKPKKQPIDKQLLKDLNTFRLELAKDIRRLNGENFRDSDEALEETVQRILDRLIFVRVAEDRGLEDKKLTLISKGPESAALRQVRDLFHLYDENFDSKLFQPHAADEVRIDGGVLQRVLRGLHETEDAAIRYDFGAIDADVLGVMYEQYLGLILKQTPKRAKLTDGAVNRKEQGIYYTPIWVVDYIVHSAVRDAIKRKGSSPDKLRVLDPACGSGSFLIRAFEELRVLRNPSGGAVQAKFDSELGTLPYAVRTAILKENLFGVDLDPKAVEIAQLNLMIRAAESRERLPTLEKNVRAGNSLIDDPAVAGTHAFSWQERFPDAMGEGGFDVVVGNPPYVRPHRIPTLEKEYFWKNFKTFRAKSDLYACFIERSIQLLRPGGVAGLIVPQTWTSLESFVHLRQQILETCRVVRLVQLPKKVFQEATVETCIIILEKERSRDKRMGNKVAVSRLDEQGVETKVKEFRQSDILENHLYNFELYSDSSADSIFQKLSKLPKLGSVVDFSYGLKTADDAKFVSGVKRDSDSKPLLRSADVARYTLRYKGEFVWYRPDLMTSNKSTARPGDKERFERPKLIVSRMGKQLVGTYDDHGYFVKDGMLLSPRDSSVSLLFVLGVINSRLLNYVYRSFFVTIDVLKNALLSLPFPNADKRAQEQVATLAGKLLRIHEQISRFGEVLTDERSRLSEEALTVEKTLDELVYEMYGLTPEERQVIESEGQVLSPHT